jgi:lipopolysaccharide transport system ATP-binding protein
MSTIISVQNLSKLYHIGVRRMHAGSLRDSISEAFKNPFNQVRRNGTVRNSELWALRDVNFEVDQGDLVGIIGRNGAGKSTLLKILSRITEPTTGHIELRGRVGSLIEVGTGFHPELTGRENVFLNGSILGMRRTDIERKFDEIVAFSEIEKFLDTPVKRYSSGMYTRLAFAVAAHLESEILIVDEVLAVGDAQFQKKCLGKMDFMAKQGRTVLLVSHNLGAIKTLCNKAIHLSEGKIVHRGSADEVTLQYEESQKEGVSELNWLREHAPGSDKVRLLSVQMQKETAERASVFTRSETIYGAMRFAVAAEDLRLNPHIHVFNRRDQLLFISSNLHDPKYGQFSYPPGEYTAVFKIPAKFLNAGTHYISVYLISDLNYWDVHIEKAISFEVVEDGSDRGDYPGGWDGLVRPCLDWSIRSNQINLYD